MQSDVPFFIANRLRNIPLVSDGRRTSGTQASHTTMKPTTLAAMLPNGNLKLAKLERYNQNPDGQVHPQTQVKRQAKEEIRLLFQPSGITASTANLVRKKTMTTASTTTRPNSTGKQNKKGTVGIAANSTAPANQTHTPILAKMLQLEQSAPKRIEETKAKPSAQPEMATTSPMLRLETTHAEGQATSPPNLTKITQTLTTQPGYQRRTPQTVLSSKFTHKLNEGKSEFAGENWALFNRPDGGFSAFEILVLISNIMIVSTIVLVLLFNWFMSIKSK